MKTNKQQIAKRLRLYALVAWGFLSLLFIAGEPIENMSFGKFCLLKLAGLVSLGLCVAVGIGLCRAGRMPVCKDDDCRI